MRASLDVPSVAPIPSSPGTYTIRFGADLNFLATPAQWDTIDAAVRNGIRAAQTRAVGR